MSSYSAIRLERFAPSFRGGADIVSLPLRDPEPGEIAVRNTWCGVNGIFDTQTARNAVDYVKIAPPRSPASRRSGSCRRWVVAWTAFLWETPRSPCASAAATVRPTSPTPGISPGWAAAMQPDDYNRSTCLNWTRKDEPSLYLYEMIQLSDDGKNRARTWQWFCDGKCFQRTLIDEVFVTADWRGWTDDSAPDN